MHVRTCVSLFRCDKVKFPRLDGGDACEDACGQLSLCIVHVFVCVLCLNETQQGGREAEVIVVSCPWGLGRLCLSLHIWPLEPLPTPIRIS